MKMENNKISVIMPSRNSSKYIEQAIDSVYEQTIEVPVELIVIDNGSNDDTVPIIENNMKKWENGPRTDRQLVLLRNPVKGVAASRNMGINKATGNLVAFLDSDDWWDLDKLDKQLQVLKANPDCMLCAAGRELVQPSGESTGRIIPVKTKITYKELLKQNSINCSSAILYTSVARKYPMEHDDSHEDYIIWLQILRDYGHALAINEPLLKTRLSEAGKSRNKIKSAKMTWKVYRYMGFSILLSCWCFIRYAVNGVKKYYA